MSKQEILKEVYDQFGADPSIYDGVFKAEVYRNLSAKIHMQIGPKSNILDPSAEILELLQKYEDVQSNVVMKKLNSTHWLLTIEIW